MAIEQAREKMCESMIEQENRAETDIIISCPSGSLEPSGTFTTSPEHTMDDTDDRTSSGRRKSNKLQGTKSLDLKRPATQASPVRKSVLKHQHHSTGGLHSPSRHGYQSTAMHSKSSHTSRQRFVSEGSKNSLSPVTSQRSRDRSYTSGYQAKKIGEGMSPSGSSSSHTISGGSRRHSASPVPGNSLHETTGKKKTISSTSTLSPSTSPRVSPKGSPLISPKTSPSTSPKVSPRASPNPKRKNGKTSKIAKRESSD